jgi:hypothetical protein
VLLTGKLDREVDLSLKLIIGRAGDHQGSGRTDLFQARRDVDAVAEQVLSFDHDVAEIDADAEDDPPLGRNISLVLGDDRLHGDSARYGINDRAELGQCSVSHQLDDATMMLGQQWVDHLAAKSLQGRQRTGLILLDETGVADDIRC